MASPFRVSLRDVDSDGGADRHNDDRYGGLAEALAGQSGDNSCADTPGQKAHDKCGCVHESTALLELLGSDRTSCTDRDDYHGDEPGRLLGDLHHKHACNQRSYERYE